MTEVNYCYFMPYVWYIVSVIVIIIVNKDKIIKKIVKTMSHPGNLAINAVCYYWNEYGSLLFFKYST